MDDAGTIGCCTSSVRVHSIRYAIGTRSEAFFTIEYYNQRTRLVGNNHIFHCVVDSSQLAMATFAKICYQKHTLGCIRMSLVGRYKVVAAASKSTAKLHCYYVCMLDMPASIALHKLHLRPANGSFLNAMPAMRSLQSEISMLCYVTSKQAWDLAPFREGIRPV